MLTSLKFNLSNTPVRREILHGRKYIVAPMAMLTEGVHNGSGGPLFYRSNEIKKAVPAWNMKPIVVYHPQINGQGVSACDPDILEKQQVGVVMKAVWNGKLRAEAWIEEDRANAVDPRIVDALDCNKLMEVSTGLFTDSSGSPGVWNGEEYVAEATNHQPDHLALLPDQIGACSIADGAGLLQVNEAADEEAVIDNAMSHSDLFSSIAKGLRNRMGMKDVYVVDVFDKYFVYDTGESGKLFRLDYSVNKDGTVEIDGDPQQVVRMTDYRPVANVTKDKLEHKEGNEAQKQNKENDMDKEKIVNALIANAAGIWNEDDREALMDMEDEKLSKLHDTLTKQPEAPAEPETPAPQEQAQNKMVSAQDYIDAAPPEIRDVLNAGLRTHAAQKAELVAKITANAKNKFTADFLSAKSLPELEGIAALAEPVAAPVRNDLHAVPMFAGQATPASPVTNKEDDNVLLLPVMNFEPATK